MRARIGLGAGWVLASMLAAGIGVWGARPPEPTPPGDPSPGGAPARASRASPPDPGPLPASLRGSEPDGALVTDASGAFVATPDALDLFDYYLAASGEEPLERSVSRIEREIRARVAPPEPALELLARYLAYREAVRELVESEGLASLPLERRLQRLRELRRGLFGPELAATLFEAQEERERAALAWQRIAQDPQLDPVERAERRAALEREWPEAERARRERVTVAQRWLERESALRGEGASGGEIQALREREFGPEAAARLADLDRARAAWSARVEHYRAERARLEGEAFRDEAEAAAALAALQERLFQGPELVRVRALDQVAAAGG